MSITVTGNWSVKILSKQQGALPQRFTITGASSGNGTYSEDLILPVQVIGNSWQIQVQASETYDPPYNWIDSSMRKTTTQTVNGNYVFNIETEDLIQDWTWDDLILQVSQPAPVIPPSPPEPPAPNLPPPIVPLPTPVPIPPRVDPPVELAMGRVFTKFEIDDKLPKQVNQSFYGMWLDYTGSACGNLLTFYTCSSDTGSYKKSVYSAQCFTCSSTPQFDIAYGHDGGSGSRDLGGYDWLTPSNAVYGQYRSLLLDHPQRRFRLGDREIFHFYVLNVNRDRMGDKLDEGNFELNLHHLSGSQFLTGNGNRNAHTGSNVTLGSQTVLRLIDDSKLDYRTLSANAKSTFYRDISSSMCTLSTGAGKVHYIVSGTLETGIYSGSATSSNAPHVYGLLYPQQGIVILDAELLDVSASFLTVTGSDVAGDNAMKLFTAISGAALRTDDSGDYLGLQGRKLKYEYVEQFFVRVKNKEYNFTNNLTYQTGSEGVIIDDFVGKPEIYISAIGLYNQNNELLAVAKPSSPIFKSFTEEALFEVILSYQ